MIRFKYTIELNYSTFPLTEQKLRDNNNYEEAIKEISPYRLMSKYKTIIDFIFCEIFTDWKELCHKFYSGEGPCMTESVNVSPEIIESFDIILSDLVLEASLELYKNKDNKYTWKTFKSSVHELLHTFS